MAVSVASQQGQVQTSLGLTNDPNAHTKNIVFVKLTDTSLEALTNYIKHANKSSTSASPKATIQFSHNAGSFTVPIIGQEPQKFNFSLTNIQETGPQASFECLESRKPSSLVSLGQVQHKAQVQASERSFVKFGERLRDTQLEKDKRTTRILDKSKIGGAAGGLVTNNVSRKHILANKSLHAGRSNDLNKYSHTHGHGSRMGLNGGNGSQSSVPHPPRPDPAHAHALNGCHTQPLNPHPFLDRNKHKKPNNPEIMKRTLRERIVHLLAVRPLKKPELLDRMTRDGLREKEKKELFPLVKQVSSMKDNTYHLSRNIWNDVSEDWPFYTDEERQAFRRRKPQNLTPPGSDGSTGSAASGHSSSSSHPASPQPSLKRPSSYLQGGDASPLSEHLAPPSASPSAKKKRVSNFVRPTNSLSPMSSLGRSPNNRSPSAPVLPPSGGPGESGESKTNAWLKTNQEQLVQGRFSPNNSSARMKQPIKNNDFIDFTTKFVRIGNSEQRRVYKAEFNKDYNRYMILHKQLDQVSQRFADLQRQLKHTPETSTDHQRLKKMIVLEHKETTNDGQFKRDQEEFQYLHKKLAHIKKLVHDYDTKYAEQKNSSNNSSRSSGSSLNSTNGKSPAANMTAFAASS